MLIKKELKNRKNLLSIALIAAFLLSIIAILLYRHHTANTINSEQAEISQSAKDNIAEKSSKTSKNADTNGGDSNDLVADNRKPNDIPTSESVSIELIDTKQSNGVVYSTVNIRSSPNNGKCVFSFNSEGSKPVVQEVISTNTQCVSNIPEVKFDKIGNWNLNITFYSDSTKAEVNKNVTIK